ncbi:Uncharacterised protein [Mycobacteroides abscessus]|nr:Uncharacterised protein [Mycobacteroides abscessus]
MWPGLSRNADAPESSPMLRICPYPRYGLRIHLVSCRCMGCVSATEFW